MKSNMRFLPKVQKCVWNTRKHGSRCWLSLLNHCYVRPTPAAMCGLCASSRRVPGKLVRNAKSQDCPRSTQSKPTLQQGFQVSQTHTKVGDILSILQPHQNVHKGLELAMFHALIHAIPRPRTPFLCLEYPVTFYSLRPISNTFSSGKLS